jgi:hypothetical protein
MAVDAKMGAHCIVEAIVTRADGTIENLGVICEGDIVRQKKTILQKMKEVLKHG